MIDLIVSILLASMLVMVLFLMYYGAKAYIISTHGVIDDCTEAEYQDDMPRDPCLTEEQMNDIMHAECLEMQRQEKEEHKQFLDCRITAGIDWMDCSNTDKSHICPLN